MLVNWIYFIKSNQNNLIWEQVLVSDTTNQDENDNQFVGSECVWSSVQTLYLVVIFTNWDEIFG